MSQNNTDFSNDMSGVELLDDYLTPLQENINTSNSGVQRPSYAKKGTVWLDTSSTPAVYKMYDGEKDVVIGKVGDTFQPATPLTTAGDILVQGADGNLNKIAAGVAGTVLTSNGPDALPSYQSGTYANRDLSNLTSTGQALFTAKQDVANLVQNLTSPSATTYLSTEGVKNESDRIISIMDTEKLNYPNYSAGIQALNHQQGTYSCPSRGWVMYQSGGTTTTGSAFYINNNFISRSSEDYWCGSCLVPVEQGDIVELREDNYGKLTFYPDKQS